MARKKGYVGRTYAIEPKHVIEKKDLMHIERQRLLEGKIRMQKELS